MKLEAMSQPSTSSMPHKIRFSCIDPAERCDEMAAVPDDDASQRSFRCLCTGLVSCGSGCQQQPISEVAGTSGTTPSSREPLYDLTRGSFSIGRGVHGYGDIQPTTSVTPLHFSLR